MPRNEAGTFVRIPGTEANPGETISSNKYNMTIDDIAADLNAPRPVRAGGTGGRTAAAARNALGAAASTTTIAAGAGLTGGGSLATSRAIAMGTPGTITSTSVNGASSTSHTHALPASAVRELLATSDVGQVGTLALMLYTGGPDDRSVVEQNTAVAGSELAWTGASGEAGASRGAGTWKLLGRLIRNATGGRVSLFIRIA